MRPPPGDRSGLHGRRLCPAMHRTTADANSWAAGPSPRRSPAPTHVTMDTLLGTSHYVEPSPHRLARARRDQAAKASSSQPSLRGSKPSYLSPTEWAARPRPSPARDSVRRRKRRRRRAHIMASRTPMVAPDAAKLLWRGGSTGRGARRRRTTRSPSARVPYGWAAVLSGATARSTRCARPWR